MEITKDIIIRIIKRAMQNTQQDQVGNTFLTLSPDEYRRINNALKRLEQEKLEKQKEN